MCAVKYADSLLESPCISISAANIKATATDKAKGTTSTRVWLVAGSQHNLKAKHSHGQLFGAGPDIQRMLLKVLKTDSSGFEVQLSSKITSTEMFQINQGVTSGQLQLYFR